MKEDSVDEILIYRYFELQKEKIIRAEFIGR